MSRQYFVVGASYDGEDQTPIFLSRGIWEIGYARNQQPAQYAIVDKMKPGDRIAIKRMVGGQGNNNKIKILAIGVISDMDYDRGIAFVRWAHPEYQGKRTVDIHGCLRTVHGPYKINQSDDTRDWLNEIFRL
jgi:hypothetical protein